MKRNDIGLGLWRLRQLFAGIPSLSVTRRRSLIAWLLLTALMAPLSGPYAQVSTEQERFARARRIEEYKTEMRQLYYEGAYREVIETANMLQTIDPENTHASLYKEMAERKLLTEAIRPMLPAGTEPAPRVGTENPFEAPSDAGTESPFAGETADPFAQTDTGSAFDGPATTDAPGDSPFITGEVTPDTPSATPVPTYTPTRRSETPWTLILIVAGLAALLLVGSLVIWFIARSSRRKMAEALNQEQHNRLQGFGGLQGMSDLPTAVGDQPTAQGGGYYDQPTGPMAGMYDMPTGEADQDVMASLAAQQPTFKDQTSPPPFTLKDNTPAPRANAQAPTARHGEDSQAPDMQETFGGIYDQPAAGRQGSGIGAAPPAPAVVKEEEPEELSLNSLLFTEETNKAPASQASRQDEEPEALLIDALGPSSAPPAEEEDALSFNSLMFDAGEETRQQPSAATPPKAAPPSGLLEEEEDGSLSLNSMLFGDDDQTRGVGDRDTVRVAEGPDTLHLEEEDPNAMSFNSLMFGDETVVPGGRTLSAQPTEKLVDLERHDTVELGGEDEDPNAMSYNSLMFGGDETSIDLGKGPAARKPAPASADGDYEDLLFGSNAVSTNATDGFQLEEGDTSAEEEDPLEATVKLDQPLQKKAETGKAPDMFERQKMAGIQALDSGDFARAVRYLSVAASLRPGDPDVVAKLEEAKSLRNS